MIRYFCDRCEKEFVSGGLSIPVYAYDGLGAKIMSMGFGHLCEKCAKKFNIVKDRLEHKEDFFNMTDKKISLMEYDFKVGDEVITSTGQFGVIESICDCEKCADRGFYEPTVKTISGVYDIYITDADKEGGFESFYKIGKYTFGNIDRDDVIRDIENETYNFKEAAEKVKEYHKQLKRLDLLMAVDGLTTECDEVE